MWSHLVGWSGCVQSQLSNFASNKKRVFFCSHNPRHTQPRWQKAKQNHGGVVFFGRKPVLVVFGTIWHCTRPRKRARRRRTGGVRSPNHKPTETRRFDQLSAPMQSLMMVAPFAPTNQLKCQRRQQQTRSQQKSQQQRSQQQLARSVALLPFRSDREVRSETARTVPLRVLGRASQCEPQSDCRARSSLPGNRLRLRRPRALQMTIRPSCRHRRSLPSR